MQVEYFERSFARHYFYCYFYVILNKNLFFSRIGKYIGFFQGKKTLFIMSVFGRFEMPNFRTRYAIDSKLDSFDPK